MKNGHKNGHMPGRIGYHLSSEEHSAPELIALARRAEEAGFGFTFISDHFHPWLDAQGQSPFVWSTIGGISQVTKHLTVITGVTCPLIRIHPAIIAQAAATTGQLLEGRFILGLGTGENLNEHVVGHGWPPIQIRREMLTEAVEIIRKLWEGDYHDHFGNYYTVENARLYSLPKSLPPLMIAAAGAESAKTAGRLGDGLISTAPDSEVVRTFQASGGKGKPTYAQTAVCYDKDEERARKIFLKLWPTKPLGGTLDQDLQTPRHFEAATKHIREEDLGNKTALGPDKDKHIQAIKKYFDAGFEHVGVNQVGENQEEFFRFYEKEILPAFEAVRG
jgi:G6PDH family F420-dependent oxidoreductase